MNRWRSLKQTVKTIQTHAAWRNHKELVTDLYFLTRGRQFPAASVLTRTPTVEGRCLL